MIVIPKEEAYESVRNRVWYPPACDNKEEHIKFLFKGCQEMEIVFCKDCRFWKNEHLCLVMSRYGSIDTKAEHYCSWGERREP